MSPLQPKQLTFKEVLEKFTVDDDGTIDIEAILSDVDASVGFRWYVGFQTLVDS
jgi:hypothetical protein